MGTRERMISAAEKVMRERGLARTTTKEIAREAGYSEGAIYKHFASKEELFMGVLTERLPPYVEMILSLPERAGRDKPDGVLVEVAGAALAFYRESFPISASIFSDPSLLERHRAEIRKQGMGPEKAVQSLARYLDAERDLGRVRRDADTNAVASSLLGACFQRAFFQSFSGEEIDPGQEKTFVSDIVKVAFAAL